MLDPQWSSMEQCQSPGEKKKQAVPQWILAISNMYSFLLYGHQPITINYQLYPQIFDG
jgi:hypothetical protein